MLKTALKPKWIATLILALAISGIFVLLSQWQFSRSQDSGPTPPSTTEKVQPLTTFYKPGVPMHADEADQMVSFRGHFEADKQVVVRDRIKNGATGFWVVTAFAVDGAPAIKGKAGGVPVIPVARGWISDPSKARPAPAGAAAITGRLLPTEAPILAHPVAGQVPSLSVAELINLWDTPSYSGFVSATSVKVNGTEVGAEVGAGAGAGAGTAVSGMEPLDIGPQPQKTPVNWLNIFYGIEWVVFAGFAVFLWWRLVSDEYKRGLEDDDEDYWEDEDPEDEDPGHGDSAPGGPGSGAGDDDPAPGGPRPGSAVSVRSGQGDTNNVKQTESSEVVQ